MILVTMNLTLTWCGTLSNIQMLLKAHPGRCPVQFAYSNEQAKAHLNLAPEWNIDPTDELLQRLINVLGEEQVHMNY